MKKNKAKFFHSFVVPTNGKSPYLENCLKSLKNQKIKSRIIITTSKPFKGIKKISKKYGAKLYIFKKHNNIADDWNRAINKSNSKYVTIAHQDDIYDKNYLFEIVKCIKKYKKNKISLIFTDYFEIKNNKKNISLKIIIKKIIIYFFFKNKNSINSKISKKRMLSFGSPIPCPSVTLNNNFKIKFDKRFWVNIDWSLWIKLSNMSGAFIYIKKKLICHRIHNKSETFKGIIDGKRLEEDKILFQKLWPNYIAIILSKIYKLNYKFI